MIDGYVHPAFARLSQRFGRDVGGDGPGGGALCVRRGDETLVDVWAGTADRDGTRPWTPDTSVMCFSMTKGFAATVLHRLVDRGLVDVDQRVAEVWPDFAAGGKSAFTIRQLLSHRTGLHDVGRLVERPDDLLDHELMASRLAAATPHPSLVGRPAYHGMTFGWLVAAIAKELTGKDLRTLFREELAEPLGVDGINLGRPASGPEVADVGARGQNAGSDGRTRRRSPQPEVAELVYSQRQFTRMGVLASRARSRSRWVRTISDALIVEGFDDFLADPSQPLLEAQWASANGTFTARAAATMYAALASGGRLGGRQFLSRTTVHELGRVQTRERDAVLGLDMRWRLGYHTVLTLGRRPSRAFGHFGYGGSGAWADPDTGLSIAFVTNRLGSATTPVADARMIRYGSEALRAVQDLPPLATPTTDAASRAS